MSLKLRDGETDFAVRRGTKGPVIYPLTDSAMTALAPARIAARERC